MNFPAKQTSQSGEFTAQVLEQHSFGENSRGLTLELRGRAALAFSRARAGQFVNIACRRLEDFRSPTPLLRRPFSLAGIKLPSSNCVYIELIYQILGPGTAWLSRRMPDDEINLLGPLGNGFTLPEEPAGKIILVGGGVGLPPMFFLASHLAEKGRRDVLPFAGLRNERQFSPDLIRRRFLDSSSHEPIIAVQDGSYGYKGTVVDALNKFLHQNSSWRSARVFSCGPHGMLKAVAQVARRYSMTCQVCMESYMACGIGLCQSCVVALKDQPQSSETERMTPVGETERMNRVGTFKLVCVNGPVFDADMVIW